MSRRDPRQFKSLNDVLRAYLPNHHAETNLSRIDPNEAGELLAKQLVKSVKGEISKSRRTRRSRKA